MRALFALYFASDNLFGSSPTSASPINENIMKKKSLHSKIRALVAFLDADFFS
jgi:hypothetical protein